MSEQKIEQKEIKKLEKQIANFQKQLSLEVKQNEIIKNYQMTQGDYQILITIYEANQLMPRGTDFFIFKTNKTACDAFVQIQIRDQIQKTTVKKDTNNPIFDQKFNFKFKSVSLQQLDKATITFRIYDQKQFILRDSLIGSFQLDWTNVYFKRNHQIYKGWLTLMDPFDQEQGIMGYLLVSISVLGENDKVTVHDSAFIKDPLTTIQDTITMPKLKLIDYGINIQIYRAENLVPLDQFAGNVDAYVIAKFSGNKVDSSVKTSCNPHWDELITIGTGIPTKSKYIILQVRNRNYIFGDDIIGVLKIPFVDLKQQSEARWGHLYGPPVNGKDIPPYNFATKMQLNGEQIGSHYRGRLLYKITGHKDVIQKNKKSKINFKFPFKPTPIVSLKSFILRLQLLDGFNLPQIKKNSQYYIHCCIGQYLITSNSFNQIKNGTISFMERLNDKKVQLPQDFNQMPDLIIYLAKGKVEKQRMCYVRIPARRLFQSMNSNQMSIYNLKVDLTLNNVNKDQSGGFLTLRAFLFSGQPPLVKQTLLSQFSKKKKFILRTFIYRAKDLPPMNETGDVDPKLVLNFCGSQQSISGDSTYNPIWNQIVDMQVQTQDLMSINIEKALICNVYDQQNGKHDNLIGNFMIKLSQKNKKKYKGKSGYISFLYHKPQWYPILNQKVDIGDPCFGHLLLGCALFKKQDQNQIQQELKFFCKNNSERIEIEQVSEMKKFELYLLGLRGLEQQTNHLQNKHIKLKIKVGKQSSKNTSKDSKQVEVKLNSANFNQMITFQVPVPKNKSIVPYVDIKVLQVKGSQQKFVGFASKSLYELVPKILKRSELLNTQQNQQQNEQDQDQEGLKEKQISEQTILDLDQLERQLNIIRQKRKKKLQALKDLEQKTKTQKIDSIQQMAVPKELASTNDNSTNKDQRLDELLKVFEQQIKNDPSVEDFVNQLQKQKDIETFRKRESIMKQKLPIMSHIIKQNQSQSQNQYLIAQGDNSNKNQLMINLDVKGHKNQLMGFKQEYSSSSLMKIKKQKSNQLKQSLPQVNKRKMMYESTDEALYTHFNEAQSRYGITSLYHKPVQKQKQIDQLQSVKDFVIDSNQQILKFQHDNRAIKYKDLERIIKQEEKFTKQAMQRQENYKYAQAVKLSLFKFKNSKKQYQKQSYLDYDTDPEQNLDIIPQWYKGRRILASDFQQLVPNKKILTLPIYQGGSRIGNLEVRQKKIIGKIKIIGLTVNQEARQQKQKTYLRLLKPRSYVCRVYILKGKSLISNLSRKPNTYLKISCRGQTYDLKSTTYKTQEYNPQYYICQQIPMQIPGPSVVRIQVFQHFSSLGITKDKILGYTQIDIQTRHFTKKWHLFTEKKPIQLRNLYSQYGNGTQGRLQVWVDIIQKKNWISNPPYRIHPPPFDKFQLRVIVWSTKQCVYKNQSFQSNDVFVRAFLGTSQAQQTDTHWACRGVGNFNYRLKFEVSYPPKPEDMYSDQFVVQIWDRDVVGYNNLIGQKRINLNKIHRIIEKAVKRKKQVKAKMKIREKGLALTQKFWFDVYNHKVKDQFGQLQSQGKVQLSFELVPIQKAEKSLKNGFGRAQPNVFPTLQQPAGRLNFNIFHPLDFFKQLCGPELYHSICYKLLCCFIIVVIVLLLYFISGSLISSAIISSTITSTVNQNNNNSSS